MEYRLIVGGNIIPEKDVGDDISISVSFGNNGYEWGKIITSNLSGTFRCPLVFPYNTPVIFQYRIVGREDSKWYSFGVWFSKTMMKNERDICSFTASDVLNFSDLDYTMDYTLDIEKQEINYAPIRGHTDAIARTFYNTYGGWFENEVEVLCPFSEYNKYGTTTAKLSCRDTMTKVALASGFSYYQPFYVSEPTISTIKLGDRNVSINPDDREEISFGFEDDKLTQVINYAGSATTMPTPKDGETLEMYNVYILGEGAASYKNTLEMQTPFLNSNTLTTSAVPQILSDKHNNGVEFSCGKIKVHTLFDVGSNLEFTGLSLHYLDYSFYASNIHYTFSKYAYFASVSGTAKADKNIERKGFIKHKQLQSIDMDKVYKNVQTSQSDGFAFVVADSEEGN